MSPSVIHVYKIKPTDTFTRDDVAYIIAPTVALPDKRHIVGFCLRTSHDFDVLATSQWNATSMSMIGYLSLDNIDQSTLISGIQSIERLFSDITHLSLTRCGNAWEILSNIGGRNKLEWLAISVSEDTYCCKRGNTIYPKWKMPDKHVHLPHLNTLKIHDLGTTQLSEFVKIVLPGLPAVRHILSIRFSNELTAGLTKYCQDIEILHFNQPSLGISNVGMSNILRLPKLKSLTFYCCHQAEWTGDIAANVYNTTLERIELDSMFTVKTIMPMAWACPNLKEFSGNYLNLQDCEPAMFMKALPKLTKFVLNHKVFIGTE